MIAIRVMTLADLPPGLGLSRQAGWNQTEADWRRFLDLEPQGCFVAELDAVSVGTTTTCIFGSVAWVAMVLVDVDARRQGVASALLEHAIDFLEGRAVTSVRLDATAAGQRVYEKLGFVPQYALSRYEGRLARTGTPGRVALATAEMLSKIVEFDFQVTGTHRAKMLTRLFEESPEAMHVVHERGEMKGFVTCRRGANATQIGPCLAEPAAGRALLHHAMSRYAGEPVFVDVPRDNAPAVETVEAAGLRVQRHFMRMVRGEPVCDDVGFLWASSGPEKG
jgi:ribosomal protein S18 acetylase RimI-like enzyme